MDKGLNMDVGNIAQFATNLSHERSNADASMAVVKLANNSAAAIGLAAVQLIQSVPKPQGSLGHHVNVKA